MNVIPFPKSYDPRLERRLVDVYATFEEVRQLGPNTRTPGNYAMSWSAYVDHLQKELGRDPIVTDITSESVNTYLTQAARKRGWCEQSVKTNGGNIRSVVS